VPGKVTAVVSVRVVDGPMTVEPGNVSVTVIVPPGPVRVTVLPGRVRYTVPSIVVTPPGVVRVRSTVQLPIADQERQLEASFFRVAVALETFVGDWFARCLHFDTSRVAARARAEVEKHLASQLADRWEPEQTILARTTSHYTPQLVVRSGAEDRRGHHGTEVTRYGNEQPIVEERCGHQGAGGALPGPRASAHRRRKDRPGGRCPARRDHRHSERPGAQKPAVRDQAQG
jgi:hypothetical protein